MPELKQSDLKIGDSVRYYPNPHREDIWENGVIKEIPSHTLDSVRVVYKCAGEWHKYQDYTSTLTYLEDLKKGWK